MCTTDRRGTRNGWAVLFGDNVPAGEFGSWRTGLRHGWCAKSPTALTATEQRAIRQRQDTLPVLILTASDTVEQRVRGLDLGADDYMSKPFALTELEARVRALTRRSTGTSSALLHHKRISFDLKGRMAYIDNQPLELSARETSLLEIFLSRSGRMISSFAW